MEEKLTMYMYNVNNLIVLHYTFLIWPGCGLVRVKGRSGTSLE